MNIVSTLRLAVCGVLLSSLQAQVLDYGHEASLLDNMLCRGEYAHALQLAKRDLLRVDRDNALLVPYVGALLIDTGNLRDAERILNSGNLKPPSPEPLPLLVLSRERAALLLARGEYKLSAAAAMKAYRIAMQESAYKSRQGYAASIAAEALLRSGDLTRAREFAGLALNAVPKRPKKASFFIPRVLYTACLVESYGPSPERAEPICLRGLSFAEQPSKPTRDLSLAYLTLAEIRFKNREFEASRAAANQSLLLTNALFGSLHQDAIKALEILSRLDAAEGKQVQAQKRAGTALKLATNLFGANSPRVSELSRILDPDSSRNH